MKIDVEGHELEVLRGASRTIAKCQPNLLVEIEQRHLSEPMSTVFHYLEERGYQGFFVEDRALHPIAEFLPERHQQLENEYSPRYINNFLFWASRR